MDFYDIVEDNTEGEGYTFNPFAGKLNGQYIEGYTSINYLNSSFGEYDNTKDMKDSTNNEGLKLYFDWLVKQGKLSDY